MPQARTFQEKKFRVAYNAAGSDSQPETVVDIFDDISDWWGWGLNRLAYALHGVSGPIRVRLNSYGGDLMQGLAIMNFLRDYSDTVTVEVLGIAASAATFVAAGGDKVNMREGSFLMIHNPFMLAIGGADEMEQGAAALRKMEDEMTSVYLSGMRKRKKFEKETDDSLRAKIRAWMDAETWFTSKEAVENGFADEVVQATETETDQAITEAAAFSPESFQNYRNAPQRVLNLISANKKTDTMPNTTDQKQSLWKRFENFFNSLEADAETETAEAAGTETAEVDPIEAARQTLEDAGYVVTESNASTDEEAETETAEAEATEAVTETATAQFTQADVDAAVQKALNDAKRKKAPANPAAPAAGNSKPVSKAEKIRKEALPVFDNLANMIYPK